MTPAEDNHDWSLESLNKAYQQGYMAGLTGQPQHAQPHPVEVLAAAWEDPARGDGLYLLDPQAGAEPGMKIS